MSRIILLISFCASLFLACNSGRSSVKVPENKMEQTEFVNLLIDVNLLEGHLTNLNVNLRNIKELSLGQYKYIFKKYDISYAEYKENYDYYIQQDDYKDILQVVYDSLDSMSVRYENIEAYKEISFVQYKQLLQNDSITLFLQHDTLLSHDERVDTILNYYRNNQHKINAIGVDSIAFEKNILKFRKNKVLFKSVMSQVYTK